jgi:uncharacterized protein (DUF1800 family)
MILNRQPRLLILIAAIVVGGVGLGIGASVQAKASSDANVRHVLNRLSFGPRPGDIATVKKLGIERYIQQQLSPGSIQESPQLSQQLADLKTLTLRPVELLRDYAPKPRNLGASATPPRQADMKRSKPLINPAEQQATLHKLNSVLDESRQARLLRAIASQRQLQEVMVDFWFNHFNVFAGKGLVRIGVGSYEETVIRSHALGNFRALLEATAQHPAMLFYLDNWQNTAPNSPGTRGRFKGLNENYARELMELHTLGVDGGYTQQDVTTLARILTGWGFCPGLLSRSQTRQPLPNPTGFCFDPHRHDDSDKTFLGQRLNGGGIEEVEQALDLLAQHPATARHISYKLAQYFVSDQPPPSLVNRLAQRFNKTNGNIKAVLETLFQSSEFWDPQYANAKFKTPYQYIVSAVRATGMVVQNVRPLYATLQQLGMPLYGCQTPDGYKNTQEAWVNPDAMTRRVSFATALASGQLPLTRPPLQFDSTTRAVPQLASNAIRRGEPVDAVQLTVAVGNLLSPSTQQAIAQSPPRLKSALILGSPEFMKR